MLDDAEKRKKEVLHLNEADGPVFKIKDDPRYTKIGKLLAFTGLDEMLQLINVIKGEMSFVGPRPLPVDEAKRIPNRYKDRFSISPGITSLWVIQGAHNLTFREWMESDLEYRQKKNIFLDIYIIAVTILSIIKWNSRSLFLVFFPLILLFYAIYPDYIWWIQIFTFLTVFILLGLDFRRKPSFLLLLLGVLIIISTFFSINKINSYPILFSYLVIFLISTTFIQDQKTVLMDGYVLGTLYMGILSAVYVLAKTLIGNAPPLLNFLENEHNLIIPYFGHAFYTIFLVSIIPYILDKAFGKKNSGGWYIIFFICNILLLLTFSKAGIIVGYIAIVIYFISQKGISRWLRLCNILSPLILFFLMYIFFTSTNFSQSFWLKEKLYKSSIPSRIEYFNQTWKVIKGSSFGHLSFGYGFDSFFELSNQYQSLPGYWSRSAHNFFIQFFIENGLWATLLLVTFLILTISGTFKKYLLYEKITIFSLLIYSFGSTADLNVSPILLVFFVLINKKETFEASNIFRNKRSQVFLSFVFLIMLIFWIRYVSVFTNLFILNRFSTSSSLQFFPYEESFWIYAIKEKEGDIDSLRKIRTELQKYSIVNTELEKRMIRSIYDRSDFCTALGLSKQFITRVPFDTTVQQTIMDSFDKCDQVNMKDMNSIFRHIKSGYKDNDNPPNQRQFLQFAASYYLKHGDLGEYKLWFDKAWRRKIENETNEWHEEVFNSPALSIPILDRFMMKLSVETQGGLSGIELIGRLAKSGEPWWKSPKMLVGYSDNGKIFYINIQDGITEKPIVLVDKKLEIANGSVNIFFENKGTILSVIDWEGQVIDRVDMNNISPDIFPNGIFPDDKIYLGYGISPNSSLVINQLLISPLE